MIIWLASYPKSGNTWVRAFLASVLYTKDGRTNLDDLKKLQQYPLKYQFNDLINNDFNLKNLSKNWIKSQSIINSNKKHRFLKTHHAMCNFNGYYFTDYTNSLGTIYIVRDPRNVVSSVYNHFSLKSMEQAKDFIFNENMAIDMILDKKNDKNINRIVYTLISSWKNHYNSWKKFRRNLLIIKYEDLIDNPEKEFLKIRKYLSKILNYEIDDLKFHNAIQENSFDKLKNVEKKNGFNESVFDNKKMKKNFFNLGPKNDYKKILDEKIVKEIEEKFCIEMKELGYL